MASKSVVGMMEMVLKLLGDSKGFDRVLKTVRIATAFFFLQFFFSLQ